MTACRREDTFETSETPLHTTPLHTTPLHTTPPSRCARRRSRRRHRAIAETRHDTMSDLALVPQTFYTHDAFGRVELVDVRPDDVVCVRDSDDQLRFASVDAFCDDAEPAPMTISAPPTTTGATANTPQ